MNLQSSPQPAIAATGALDPHDARRQRLTDTYAGIRAHYSDAELAAIKLLYETAKDMWDTGGGRRCAKLLLGLYNGARFPFDLTDLRALDIERYRAARIVIDFDARRTYTEVHTILNAIYADGRSVGDELEFWAWRLRWGKHVKKADVPTDFGPKWRLE
jgi:hypothetical protein